MYVEYKIIFPPLLLFSLQTKKMTSDVSLIKTIPVQYTCLSLNLLFILATTAVGIFWLRTLGFYSGYAFLIIMAVAELFAITLSVLLAEGVRMDFYDDSRDISPVVNVVMLFLNIMIMSVLMMIILISSTRYGEIVVFLACLLTALLPMCICTANSILGRFTVVKTMKSE